MKSEFSRKCRAAGFFIFTAMNSMAFSPDVVYAQDLKLAIGVSAMSNIFSKIKTPFEASTGIKLVFIGDHPNGMGSDEIFKDVDQGKAEGGAGGIHWEGWLNLMKQKGYSPRNKEELRNRVIGNDRLQMITYPGAPDELSMEQIQGLLTGKITNWKDAGGKDQPVNVILSKTQPATQKFLEDRFLQAPVRTSGTKTTDSATAMLDAIGSTPGALGFGPMDLKGPKVHYPKHPTIGRPITFIWKGDPSPEISKLLTYLKEHAPN